MKPLNVIFASVVYLILIYNVQGFNNSSNVTTKGSKGVNPKGLILPKEETQGQDHLTINNGTKNSDSSTVKEDKKNANISLCQNGLGSLKEFEETYPLIPNNTHQIFPIPENTYFKINITNIPPDVGFLIAQAHSQTRYLILSHHVHANKNSYINDTNPGIVIEMAENDNQTHREIYLANCHFKNLTVLFMVRNYSHDEPVPGGFPLAVIGSPSMPHPYLMIEPDILTTEVTFRAAAYPHRNLSVQDTELRYDTYLTYMYERDLAQNSYWNILVATSTVKGIEQYGKLVLTTKNNNTAAQLTRWFVSYSGVGAVIGVVVRYNSSGGVLYSSAVSYGCNFIDTEEYRCTKLVNPLAKLFCAVLLFIGGILLYHGHRWLNFTMFTSGFLFFWFILFLLFAQVQETDIGGLGWGTLMGALAGGIGWLLLWHRFQRPFHSAILIITMNVIFVGMVITYFLRYAVNPSTNLAAFVVFPVCFAIAIIAYSIADIKRVHIFSCTLLGSYAFVVPFAFYFGSSLTYIVINVVGLITVEHYSDTLGYPPFQVCDIILLCLWVALFTSGMAYQLYRERSGPPFYPPNRASWIAAKKVLNFVFDKIFSCLPMDPDPGGIGIEDHPTWMLRLSYSFSLIRKRITCRQNDPTESGYESLQRVRTMSQSVSESEPGTDDSLLSSLKQRISGWFDNLRGRLQKDDEELLQAQDIPEPSADEEMLQDPPLSCCTFGKSQVVLDDAYISNTRDES